MSPYVQHQTSQLRKRFSQIYRILRSMSSIVGSMHCTKNPIYVFPETKLRGLVPIFGCSKIGRPIQGICKSLIDTCGNWETEHYNSVLEIMRPQSSNSGIRKSEPDIYVYIGFSLALHLRVCSQLTQPTKTALYPGRYGTKLQWYCDKT